MGTYRFHHEARTTLAAPVEAVFTWLDDPTRFAAHMGRRSLMMAGNVMRTETDANHGQAVGSVIHMGGSMLGFPLFVEETIVERTPPIHKAWETVGEPRLLVFGRYRMGFNLAAGSDGTDLSVWIDYDLPVRGIPRWLGGLFSRFYADWCVKQIVQEATQAFSAGQP